MLRGADSLLGQVLKDRGSGDLFENPHCIFGVEAGFRNNLVDSNLFPVMFGNKGSHQLEMAIVRLIQMKILCWSLFFGLLLGKPEQKGVELKQRPI